MRQPSDTPANVQGCQEVQDLCGQEQEAGRQRYKYLSQSTEDYQPVLRVQALISQDNSIHCHRWWTG